MDEDLAGAVFAQLLIAVDYIHSHGIVHGDIKPDNVLVSQGLRGIHACRVCRGVCCVTCFFIRYVVDRGP